MLKMFKKRINNIKNENIKINNGFTDNLFHQRI